MMPYERQLDRVDQRFQEIAAQRPDSTIEVLVHTDGTETAHDRLSALLWMVRQVVSTTPKLVRVRATAVNVTWMSRARFVVRIEMAPSSPGGR